MLVVDAGEARIVRQVFDLYEQAGCLWQLTVEVSWRNLRSKPRLGCDGRQLGDRPLGRGQLHHLLTNPVYRGRTRHGATLHEGRHPAIIDAAQWERVQLLLQSRAGRRRNGADPVLEQAILTGKLTDETGDRLTPTHTVKGARRYHYYVSNRLICGPPDLTGWRLPDHGTGGRPGRQFARAAEIGVSVCGHVQQSAEFTQLSLLKLTVSARAGAVHTSST